MKQMKQQILKLSMKTPEFSVVEAFNTLRTNIIFSGEDIKTIMVTSTWPSEGKSYVAMQLAKSFAEMNKRVVYMDCDLRKSVTTSRYQIKGKNTGLTEYITGQGDAFLYQTNIENLYVVLSGHLVPKSIEILQSKKFGDVLQALRDSFDYVIVDAPPLGSVVDASVIAPQVDGTVFVVRSDAVGRTQAIQAKKQLEKSKGRLLGVALNGVGIRKGAYYYKYSKEYGHYYYKDGEEDKDN